MLVRFSTADLKKKNFFSKINHLKHTVVFVISNFSSELMILIKCRLHNGNSNLMKVGQASFSCSAILDRSQTSC